MIVEKPFYVYILCSKPHGVLYIGFTNDLARRTHEHREHLTEGFTKRYWISRLVYYEAFGDPTLGIQREKQMKKWLRAWKIALIEKHNPEWEDLWQDGDVLPLPIPGKFEESPDS